MAKFQGFEFNLLPPKPKALIQKEDERSYSQLYAAFLIFFIVCAWLGLGLLNSWVDKNGVQKWKDRIADKNAQIDSYQSYAEDNYELFLKSKSLSEVVEKHSDPDFVFNTIDKTISQSTPKVEIVKYARNSDGSYQVTGVTNNSDDVSALLNDFFEDASISDVNLISMKENNQNQYEFILELDINAVEPTTATT